MHYNSNRPKLEHEGTIEWKEFCKREVEITLELDIRHGKILYKKCDLEAQNSGNTW